MDEIKFKKESWYKRFIKTSDRNLNIIVVFAFLLSLFFQVYLLNFCERDELIYNVINWFLAILLSILAAGIFHFFIVHYKLIKNREKYAPIIFDSIYNLYTISDQHIIKNLPIHYIEFKQVGFIPNRGEWIAKQFCKIDNGKVDWINIAYVIAYNTKNEFEIISNYKNEYPDINRIITNLYTSDLVKKINGIRYGVEDKNDINLEELMDDLYEYLQEVHKLHPLYLKILTKRVSDSVDKILLLNSSSNLF